MFVNMCVTADSVYGTTIIEYFYFYGFVAD